VLISLAVLGTTGVIINLRRSADVTPALHRRRVEPTFR
jgi:hypothetical protein